MTVSFYCNGIGGGRLHFRRRPLAVHADRLSWSAKLLNGCIDEVESCDAHPAKIAAAHAHDRSFVRPSAGTDHGVVSVTARAPLRQRHGQADEAAVDARLGGERIHGCFTFAIRRSHTRQGSTIIESAWFRRRNS